jgi:hypothetical protein
MAAEYRGFDFGRKADIAPLDRRKRLKNHDVVFKRRDPMEAFCGRRSPLPGRFPARHRRRRTGQRQESLFAPSPVSRIKQCQCVNRRV